MELPNPTDKSRDQAGSSLQPRTFITGRTLQLVAVAFIAAGCAVILPRLDIMFAVAMVLVFPVSIAGLYVLKNPFNGVFSYYLYEFLRPYDFITALRPLRLALVIELLTVVSWIVWFIRFRPAIKWDRFNWFYLAFLCFIAIGVYVAANRFLAYSVFQVMMVNFVMFSVATNTVDNTKRLEKIIWLLVLTHIYFAFIGIYHFALSPGISEGMETSGAVGGSFMADENDFAMSLNVMIPIAFFLSFYYSQRWKKILCLAIILLFTGGVIVSFSRGGFVGFAATISYCIWYSGKRTVYFSLALVAALAFISISPDKYVGEMETIKDTQKGTADARLRYWAAAGRIFLDYPIIGVGAKNGGVYMPNYIEGMRNPKTQWGRTFHGLFPQIAAELGTVGLALYTLMMFYVLAFLNRIRKRETENEDQLRISLLAKAFTGSIVAFIITSTFLSTAFYPQLWTVYTFALILLWIQRGIDKKQRLLAETESITTSGALMASESSADK